jgi:uncharacterized membrane protein YjdF
MIVKKGQWLILITNIVYLSLASLFYISKKNYEFILYVGVIVLFLLLIVATNKKVNYPNFVLWGLTIWGILHMLGGGLVLKNGAVLYKLILIPISETYGIFRFDQFVHIFGFCIATLIMFVLIKPSLKPNTGKWASLLIVVVMAGVGLGALNEMVEFLATVITPETGVGGYVNTSLDLVSNLIGAVIASVIIKIKNGNL